MMRTIIWMTTSTILGGVGWWLGERFGFMTAYALSGVGSLIGVYVGIKLHMRYFE